MRSRTARAALALAVTGLVLGAAACTGAPAPVHEDSVARLTDHDADRVDVAASDDAATRALSTSRVLFSRSPGAVVAPADDAAAVRRAAALAEREHVPALLVGATEGTTSTAGRESTPGASAANERTRAASAGTGRDAVADELTRLHASWWIPVGGVRLRTDARRTDPDDAPGADGGSSASRPARTEQRTTTVLVTDRAADPAPCATAAAAGAHVVTMPDGVTDPTASRGVVETLHEAAAPTLLVGSAFRDLGHPTWSVRAAATGYQLPHGGQRPFDGHRYAALYGVPGVPVLGVLGEQGPAQTVARAEQTAAQYDGLSDVPVSPALEVIATVAAGAPGPDGDYSNELSPDQLEPYLDAAHIAHMPVILDLQSGRTDFLTQAKRYQELLERPDVWLALDPEWRLGPDQVPLRQIGSVSAQEVNAVSDWLAGIVRSEDLPPKALVLHQFRLSMLQDRSAIDTSHPELDVLIHVDGQGSQPDKQATWNALHVDAPAGVHWGWKNFIDEDTPMLTPQQTMEQVQPTPSLITYQ